MGEIGVGGGVTTNKSGVEVGVDAKLEFEFFLRLCIHDDPFGHGCSTLFDCKGDVDLSIDPDTSFTLSLAVNLSSGLPLLSASSVVFDVSIPSMSGLCDVAQKLISENLPKINKEITEKLSNVVKEGLKKVEEELANIQNVTLNKRGLSVGWMLSQEGTGTNESGVEVMGTLTTFLNGTPSPSFPSSPLPSPLSLSSPSHFSFLFSDSLFNALVYGEWASSPHVFSFSGHLLNQTVDVCLNLTRSPLVNFTRGSAASVTVWASVDVADPSFNVSVDLNMFGGANFSINSTGYLVASLSPKVTVNITKAVPPIPEIIEKLLEKLMEEIWANLSTKIDNYLTAHAPHIPNIPAIKAEQIEFGDSYILVLLETSSELRQLPHNKPGEYLTYLKFLLSPVDNTGGKDSISVSDANVGVESYFVAPLLDTFKTWGEILSGEEESYSNLKTFPCPDLSSLGAHQDDCTVG
eukprot:CAMPEP_0174256194 /NCGR_PEP_ID=MMETSP0439-20130205/5455_1 /TAXON_ID=0 /ORGANISM="Stereomyxa ramosa, Strain Chinc5" /LENGTH=463 /DNA_ID=CAMNT_0015338705 /DNA_START=230 /DNA_END=1621 /DNA_ORIENTATION=+